MQQIADRIVKTAGFEYFIIALIIGNGVLLGMETSPELVQAYGPGCILAIIVSLGCLSLKPY